jgi:hypothetical protein
MRYHAASDSDNILPCYRLDAIAYFEFSLLILHFRILLGGPLRQSRLLFCHCRILAGGPLRRPRLLFCLCRILAGGALRQSRLWLSPAGFARRTLWGTPSLDLTAPRDILEIQQKTIRQSLNPPKFEPASQQKFEPVKFQNGQNRARQSSNPRRKSDF